MSKSAKAKHTGSKTVQVHITLEAIKRTLEAYPGVTKIKDISVQGLYIRPKASGGYSWYLQKRFNNKVVDFKLGSDQLPIAEARKKARLWAASVEQGIDPRDKPSKMVVTFKSALERHLELADLAANTRRIYKSVTKNNLSDFLNVDLSTVTADMLTDLYYDLKAKKGKALAIESLRMISSIWNRVQTLFKDENGKRILGPNPFPAFRVELPKGEWKRPAPKRKVLIAKKDLGRWLYEVERLLVSPDISHVPRMHFAAFIVSLFTGFRIQEVFTLGWSQIDFEHGYIILDPEQAKNKQKHTLPLSPYLLAHFQALHDRRTSSSDVIFHQSRNSENPLIPASYVYAMIIELTGIDFQAHGMRRTFASVAEFGCKISKTMIKRLLNHKHTGDVTDGYTMDEYDPLSKSDAVNQIADEILRLRDEHIEKIRSNVVLIERAA